MAWKVLYYQTESGHEPVAEFIDDLPLPVQQKVFSVFELVETRGMLPYPYSRDIKGVKKLRELRIGFAGNIYRIFYFPHRDRNLILVHGFTKRSQKTPRREIETAANRMKHYLERHL